MFPLYISHILYVLQCTWCQICRHWWRQKLSFSSVWSVMSYGFIYFGSDSLGIDLSHSKISQFGCCCGIYTNGNNHGIVLTEETVFAINTLRPRQNGRHFADDTFKRIFLNENNIISIKISLKFVPKGLINNIPALVLIMAWRRPGDKPLSEPMMVRSLTHICVTRPQWVKSSSFIEVFFHFEINININDNVDLMILNYLSPTKYRNEWASSI